MTNLSYNLPGFSRTATLHVSAQILKMFKFKKQNKKREGSGGGVFNLIQGCIVA